MTIIYSKLYKIDILTRLPFIKEETRIFQKLSLLGPAEVGSPVYVKSTIYMVWTVNDVDMVAHQLNKMEFLMP